MKLLNSALALALASSICAVAAEVDWSAPVRVLGTPPAEEPMNMAMRRPPPPKSLVRGLLPQYQTPQAFRSEVAVAPDTEKAAMRFLLALPDRVLLIEASVSINGQPYKMVREQRIDRLLAELNKPASEEPGPVAEDSVTDESSVKAVAASSSEPAPKETPIEDQTADASKAASEPEAPLIPVPSDALEARLRRYATVTGRPPTRDELRWLLTKWVNGPTLLILDDNFQRFRSTQAPAFQVLDRDLDGKVSAQELKDAEQTLLLCDVNQNDVVEYAEIAEVADDPRRQSPPAPVQALVPLLDAASAAKAFRRLAKAYGAPLARFDGNSNGQLDESEFGELAEVEPDVVLAVSFDANDSGNSTTRITHVSTDLGTQMARSLGSSITIPAGQTLVEFSAVQSATWSGSDQISVGVVNDGYPLLPAIDPNEDRRLTIRELRRVVDLLQRFDVDKDGEISANEIPSTVRVSFGLGPSVHLHLGDIRNVHPPSTAVPLAAPEWFTSMDGRFPAYKTRPRTQIGRGKGKAMSRITTPTETKSNENGRPKAPVDVDVAQAVDQMNEKLQEMRVQLGGVIVGMETVSEQLLIALLCRGHCMLQGMPGLAKTMLVSTMASVLDLSFKRVQFTPDLMPGDITGTEVLEEDHTTGKRIFRFVEGRTGKRNWKSRGGRRRIIDSRRKLSWTSNTCTRCNR